MSQKLVVPVTFKIYQDDNLVRTETIAQNVIKIGRDQKSHLRLDDESVSRFHAVIETKGEGTQLINLSASVQVNGQALNNATLKTGDEIKIGKFRLVVELGAATDAAAIPAATATPSIPPAAAASSTPASTVPSVAPPPASAGAVRLIEVTVWPRFAASRTTAAPP